MAELTASERRKWIIVGALAVLLVAVAWLQLGPSPDVEVDAGGARPRLPESSGAAATRARRGWPRPELADVLQKNPFASLRKPSPAEADGNDAAAPTPDPEKVAASALEAFQSRRVRAVFFTDQGPAALLGTTTVREGDVVDGVRIVSIGVDGLIVEPAQPSTDGAARITDELQK